MNLKEALLQLGKDESVYQGADACMRYSGKHELSHYYAGMSQVWDELMETEVVSNDTMSIRVYICEEMDGDNYYLHVDGYEPSSEEVYWGMDFVPWSQWLGCQIMPESIQVFGLARCIGEILWEMTFYGWSNAKVQERGDDILERGSK